MKINPKLKKDLKSFLLDNIHKEQNQVQVFSADVLGVDEKKVLGKKFSDLNWSQAHI